LNALAALTLAQITDWKQQAQTFIVDGRVADRISQLALANPQWFAVYIHCEGGQSHTIGETECVFPLMSVIKPFLLLYLLEHGGMKTVFEWVGMEASDAPFNALEQLKADGGRPRNPMINSGAIALADRLPGKDGQSRCQQLCDWLNQKADCQLSLDQSMLDSVRIAKNAANYAIAATLAAAGWLDDAAIALDTYEQICCLSGQVQDLALLGTLLTRSGHVAPQHRRAVNAMMLTCGLYQASAAIAVRIGLPIKSGISGALLAVVPDQGAIACYSPPLDNIGNPITGLAFIEMLGQELQLSVFE
jgi:glutaminase